MANSPQVPQEASASGASAPAPLHRRLKTAVIHRYPCQKLKDVATATSGKWVCGCGHVFGDDGPGISDEQAVGQHVKAKQLSLLKRHYTSPCSKVARLPDNNRHTNFNSANTARGRQMPQVPL